MNIILQIILLILGYLLGSIPVGFLLTKYYTGKNILNFGSGNVGSTNVKRIAGKKLSIITQILDMMKGAIPVSLYFYLSDVSQTDEDIYVYMLAISCIIGHNFSVFLKFRGGKGVNTTLGASVLIAPLPVFISVGIYFIVKWLFQYVSLGSIFLAVSLPISEFLLHSSSFILYYLLMCSLLILLMHRSNIIRLLHNQELPG
ncbi:glycerol-3-phosphate 1-O-acyltransferase PlsY [Labilibaculum sp.]|uniref:glycerol-3-phosphate 1-O-acyltransferase PlsY n=1 Tax=Labilibaculum sp. TaxID=2060723 RepID=UPI003561FC49